MGYGKLKSLSKYLTDGFWKDAGEPPRKWNLTDSGINAKDGVITYSVGSNWIDADGISAGRAALVRDAFAYIESVTGIVFQETTATAQSDVDISFTDQYEGAFAAVTEGHYYNSKEVYINNAGINIASDWYGSSTASDDYVMQTIIHEVGHLLGLGHQSNYNGSATFPNDADFKNDSWQSSIMSYFSQTENTNIDADFAFVQTFMAADLHALEVLYGDQSNGGKTFGISNAFTGDTTFGFNTNISAADDPIMANLATYGHSNAYTIVDSGGTDTLDFSGWSADQFINLTVTGEKDKAPSISSIGGLEGNLMLAVGTVIENAIGGSGNDGILGNEYDNDLQGNAGMDIIDGGDGDDNLSGGDDDDLLIGGKGNDFLTGGDDTDTFYFKKKFGVDVITDFETIDIIDVSKVSQIKNYNDLIKNHLEQVGDDAVISYKKYSITINDFDISDLDTFHFLI